VPKGVVISTGALRHFLDAMDKNYPLVPEDRTAETADTGFDISVFDMFASWRAGASLHIIPPTQILAPAKFMVDHAVTVWFSVPSIAGLMNQMGLLKPSRLSSLRLTFFCGEPLLVSVAEAWQAAAPNTLLVNMYGPTEATVMCMGQICNASSVLTRDCVAIGRPFGHNRAAIADEAGELFSPGTQGELLLAGHSSHLVT
jgi:non-ribosomal peptide synthetase component F